MLTPVDNPAAYGLVETRRRRQRARLPREAVTRTRSRCDTINAGIYVLEPESLDRIPADTVFSIERGYFPSLVQDKARRSSPTCTAGTGSTSARRRNTGRRTATSWTAVSSRRRSRTSPDSRCVSPNARIDDGARLEGPCFIDRGAVIKKRRPHRPVQRHRRRTATWRRKRSVDGAILWPNTWVDRDARLTRRDRRTPLPLRPQRGPSARRDVRRQVRRHRLLEDCSP